MARRGLVLLSGNRQSLAGSEGKETNESCETCDCLRLSGQYDILLLTGTYQ